MRPGRPACSNCEDRWAYDDLDDDYGECPLCVAGRANYLVAVKADGAASINVGERNSTNLYGDVILGIVSARTELQAMRFMAYKIPEAARQEDGWFDMPEDFGLRAYKLAKTAEEEEQEEG